MRCSSCDSSLSKAEFSKDELKQGVGRRCKSCVASTDALFSALRSNRRVDDVSADAEVERLRSVEPKVQADAANRLWKASRTGTEAVDRDIAAAGAIGPLVGLLRCREDERAWFAAGALQSLSCRSQLRKQQIVEAGGVPLLVALLTEGDVDDKEVAAMALQNLTDGSTDSETMSADARQKAVRQPEASAVQTRAASTLGMTTALTVPIAVATTQVIQSGAIRPLAGLLLDGEDGAKEAAASSLANLLGSTDEQVKGSTLADAAECDAIGALVMKASTFTFALTLTPHPSPLTPHLHAHPHPHPHRHLHQVTLLREQTVVGEAKLEAARALKEVRANPNPEPNHEPNPKRALEEVRRLQHNTSLCSRLSSPSLSPSLSPSRSRPPSHAPSSSCHRYANPTATLRRSVRSRALLASTRATRALWAMSKLGCSRRSPRRNHSYPHPCVHPHALSASLTSTSYPHSYERVRSTAVPRSPHPQSHLEPTRDGTS